MSTSAELVKLLKEASDAYYNGDTLKMDDDTYDAFLEKLREADPTNPFLSTIGAPPPTGGSSVLLPYSMPSLDKIKPGQDALNRFLTSSDRFILSEKLDGLSAMWIPDSKSLYLRGDGTNGQDISHLVRLGIQGLKGAPGAVIRGELVAPRAAVSNARSWVNGIVHRKDADPTEVAKIHFVAYDLLKPTNLVRSQAFEWLSMRGFETPWTAEYTSTTEEILADSLKSRREKSPYDTDGIVVAVNAVPRRAAYGKNPKDAVAFKMPLADQSAETTVRAIHWAASAQGYLIPRVEFDPVTIGAATIQFCTGHNAKNIETLSLGPGARIVIRRSGDVIPALDRVVSAAAKPEFPPTGSYTWATAVHIKSTADATESSEILTARLQHFIKTLEIPGCGPSAAAALVTARLTSPRRLLEATQARLSEILGPKTGAAFHTNLRAALASAQELMLMKASALLPRGVGDAKLTTLFAAEKDPRRWATLVAPAPAGWTTSSFQSFLEELPKYVAWREAELGHIPFPKIDTMPVVAIPLSPNKQTICMTGFRDKVLEAAVVNAGHAISPTLTAKVTVLLVPDGERKASEKVKAAEAKGVPILTVSVFKAKYLSQ